MLWIIVQNEFGIQFVNELYKYYWILNTCRQWNLYTSCNEITVSCLNMNVSATEFWKCLIIVTRSFERRLCVITWIVIKLCVYNPTTIIRSDLRFWTEIVLMSSQHSVQNSIDIGFHITHMLTLTYPDTSNKTTKVYECLRRNRFDDLW